jgi:hypothetical protein
MRIVAIGVIVMLVGCGTPLFPRAAPPEAPPPERIPLQTEVSPLSFRWLSDHAVLVAPETGSRELASFGNYVDRSALGVARAHLAVWDDEEAWHLSREAQGTEPAPLVHKRAQFLKDAEPAPVEEFTVFDSDGSIVYERNFRDWPLTATDE